MRLAKMKAKNSFDNILKELDGFAPVEIYKQLQLLKKQIIEDIENGNGVKDYELLGDKQLHVIYKEIAAVYRYNLMTNPKRLQLGIDYFKSQMTHEQLVIKENTSTLEKKDLQSNTLSFHRIIKWKENEKERVINVIRNDTSKGGRGKVVVPLKVERAMYTQGIKHVKHDMASLKTTIYVGRPDIAYYDFFVIEFLVKNAELMKVILLLESEIVKYIQTQWAFRNLQCPELALEFERKQAEKLKVAFDKLNTCNRIWSLWKKRHALVFDYFVALQFIENHKAMEAMISETENLLMTAKKKHVVSDTKKYEKRLQYLHNEWEEGFLKKEATLNRYEHIKSSFLVEFQAVEEDIKKLSEKLE